MALRCRGGQKGTAAVGRMFGDVLQGVTGGENVQESREMVEKICSGKTQRASHI